MNIEGLDKLDNAILDVIENNARMSYSDIGEKVGFKCLKRAGYQNVGELLSHIENRDDLLKIRNLGKKSADEIMWNLL